MRDTTVPKSPKSLTQGASRGSRGYWDLNLTMLSVTQSLFPWAYTTCTTTLHWFSAISHWCNAVFRVVESGCIKYIFQSFLLLPALAANKWQLIHSRFFWSEVFLHLFVVWILSDYTVWTKEEGGEGGRGESSHGASLWRLTDSPEKGHPCRVRRRRRWRGKHFRYRPEILARTSSGHV